MKEEPHKEEEDIDFPPPPVCTRLPPRPAISKTSSPPKELSPASDCHAPETDHHLLLNGGQTEEIKVNIRPHLDSSSPHNCTTTTIPPSFVEGAELAEHVKEQQQKALTIEKTLVVKSNSNCFKTPALPSEGKKPSRCSPSVKKRQKTTTASADPTTEGGKYLLSCNNGQPKGSPANGTSATLAAAAAAAAVFSFNSLTAAAADVALVRYSSEELLRDFVAIGKHSFLCPRSQQFLAKRYPGLVLRRAMKTAAENHHRLEAEEGEEEAAAVVEEDIINEIVIDEFSLLLFRSLDDYNVLKDREDAIKAEEETAEKQRQHEENLRMNRVKKKGRRSQAELKREKKEAKKRVRQERKEQRKKEREERRQQRKLALQTSQNSGSGADAGGVGGPMAQLAEDMAERKRQRREQRKEAKVAEREKRREERRRQRQTKRGEDKRAKRISNKSSTVPCAPNVQPSDISSSTSSSSSSNAVENVVSGLLRLRDGGLKSAEHDGSPVNFKPQQLPSFSSSTAEMVTASIAASTTTAAAAAAAATKRPSSATIGIAATRRNGLMRAETTAGLLQCMPPASKMAKLEEVKLEEFGRTTPSSNRSLVIGIAASNSSGAMQLQQTVPTDASFAQQTKTLQQHQNVFKAALERDLLQKVSDAVPSLQQGGGGSSTTGHLPHADQQQDNPCSFRDSLAYNFHQSLATLYAIDPSLAAKAALGLPSAPFGGDSAAALNKANSVLQQSSQKFPAVSDLPQQQQQHQLVVNNGRVLGVDAAAALGLPSTSAVLPPPSSASCGVSRPPPPPLDSHPANLAVATQKVGRTSAAVAPTSASIQQTNAAVHIPFKNGRWCNMHATIAHEIAKHVEAQKKIANVRTTNNTGGSHRKQSTTTSATGCGGREHQQKTERKQSSVSVATSSSSSSFPAQQSNEQQQQQQNNKNGSRGANNAMANASAPTMAQHHQLLQLQQEQGKRTGNNLLSNSASASSFPMLSAASANLNLQQQIALLMGQQQQQQQQQRISTFNDSSPLHSHGARFPVQGTNSLGPFASSSGPLNPLGGLSQFLSANSVHPAVGSMPPHLFGGFPIQPMGPGGGSLTSGNSDAAAAAQLHQHAQLLALLQQQSNNNPQQQHHPASLSAAFALQPNSNNNIINAANDSNNASAAATQCAMANNFLAQFGASSVASNSAANSNATNNINTMVAAGAGGHQQQPNNNSSNNMLSSLVGPANLAFAANILNPTALPSLQQQQQQNSLALSQMANTGSNNAATAAGGAHALMHSGTFNHNNSSGGNEATGAESILAAFLSGQSLVTSSASNALNSSNPAMGIEQFVRSQFGGRMDGPPMMALGNQMQLSKMTGSNLIPPPPSALLSAGHLSVNPASVINPIEQELLMMRHFGLVNQRSQQLLGASLSGAGMDSLPPQNGPPKQDTGVISTANGSTAAAHNRHDMSRT